MSDQEGTMWRKIPGTEEYGTTWVKVEAPASDRDEVSISEKSRFRRVPPSTPIGRSCIRWGALTDE